MKTLILFFILLSNISFAEWIICPGSQSFTGRYEDLYFINENTGWIVSYSTIKRTTNGGATLETQFSGGNFSFRSVAFNNANTGWAGTINGELFKTTNGGLNWIRIDDVMNIKSTGYCEMWVVGDSCMYGSGRYSGPTSFTYTTNAGESFNVVDMGAFTSYQIGVFFKNRNLGFIGGTSTIPSEGAVVLRTTNGGISFQKRYRSYQSMEHIWQLLFNNENFGYGTVQSFYNTPMSYIVTTDGGNTWERKIIPGTNSTNQYAESISFINPQTGWIASGNGSGMYQTTNGGTTFQFINQNYLQIHSMFTVKDSIVYAGGASLYKYTRGTTYIENGYETGIPLNHSLNQNYPNPFNPSTKINFSLFRNTSVSIKIYSITGEFIKELYKGFTTIGNHTIEWNASELPSGAYYINMLTNEGHFTKKAILMK